MTQRHSATQSETQHGDIRDLYDEETISKFFRTMGGQSEPAHKVEAWWKQWDRTHVEWAKRYNHA